MDPLPKWESALTSASSQVTIVQSSQNGSAPAHLIALEQLRIGLRSLTPTPGSGTPTSLAEGMLQQQYVEPKSLLENRWGRLGFPQKKAFLGKLRRRHRDHRSPYPVDRDSRIFRSGNKTQNWFRCECLYCQARGQSISGERDGSTNPSSWDTLVQGLGGLTLNLGADKPGLLPEGAQQQQQHLQQQQQQQQQQHAQQSAAPPSLTASQTVTTASMITTKTLPLVLKAATATMPASVVGQRPTIAMVTAINSQKAVLSTDVQNTPVNLQTSSKVTGPGAEAVQIVAKNTVTLVQATPPQPIKVPQFIPPPRLTPRPNFLPQVRPKPVAQNNIPIAPAPPPMLAAPQLIQRPVMLTKFTPTTLPTSQNSIHPVRVVNGQTATIAKTFPMAQLTSIVIATPGTRLAGPQTVQLSKPSLEKQTVKSHPDTEEKQAESRTVTPPAAPKPKREENPQKLAFMVSLGLVTHDHLEEIQSKRQERKRRTTANPVYSGAVFEPERKKSAVTYLNSTMHPGTRKRGRPPKYNAVLGFGALTPTSPQSSHPDSPENEKTETTFTFPAPVQPVSLPSPTSTDGDIHEDFCSVCRKSGQLLMCDTCSRVYHLDCLDPPLKTIPKGMWICPRCQDQMLKKEEAIPWPGTLAIVHSYIAYKAAKEEEKQKLLKWSSDLKQEREQLEQKVKELSSSISKCMEMKNSILARQKEMRSSLDKVKQLIRLIHGIDLSRPVDSEATVGALSNGPDCTPPTNAASTPAPSPSSQSCTANCNQGEETK